MRDVSKDIEAIIGNLGPLYDVLLERPLTTSQRKSLGTFLFPLGSRFVGATVQALQEFGSLFLRIPVKPAHLQMLQDNAMALRGLRRHLFILYQLCSDTYFSYQAEAIKEAMSVHKWSRKEAERLFQKDDDLLQREVALAGAEQFAPCKGRGAKARRARRNRRPRNRPR